VYNKFASLAFRLADSCAACGATNPLDKSTTNRSRWSCSHNRHRRRLSRPGTCSITQSVVARPTDRRLAAGLALTLRVPATPAAAAHRFRPAAATWRDRESESSKWPRQEAAAFPIWRIAFYRHLDDRSAVGPIIDIGRFYRSHAAGQRCIDPRPPCARTLPQRARLRTRRRRMMYAAGLIKHRPPCTASRRRRQQ